MATLLITSKDDGEREDCNIFYAGYLLVDAPAAQVDAFVKGITAQQHDEYQEDSDKLLAALVAAGMPTSRPDTEFLIY